MSDDYYDEDYEQSNASFEQGLEGEFDSEDPPEGYESWAEWYYYNGESTNKREYSRCDEYEDEQAKEERKKREKYERQQLIQKAKEEGVHPDIYSRTDSWCPKWVRDGNTWFYKHPVFYQRFKIAIFSWLIFAFIAMLILFCLH